jgi:hypothetical protein
MVVERVGSADLIVHPTVVDGQNGEKSFIKIVSFQYSRQVKRLLLLFGGIDASFRGEGSAGDKRDILEGP